MNAESLPIPLAGLIKNLVGLDKSSFNILYSSPFHLGFVNSYLIEASSREGFTLEERINGISGAYRKCFSDTWHLLMSANSFFDKSNSSKYMDGCLKGQLYAQYSVNGPPIAFTLRLNCLDIAEKSPFLEGYNETDKILFGLKVIWFSKSYEALERKALVKSVFKTAI